MEECLAAGQGAASVDGHGSESQTPRFLMMTTTSSFGKGRTRVLDTLQHAERTTTLRCIASRFSRRTIASYRLNSR